MSNDNYFEKQAIIWNLKNHSSLHAFSRKSTKASKNRINTIKFLKTYLSKHGWSPILEMEWNEEETIAVLCVIDWQDGRGEKPKANVYIGPTGLVNTFEEGTIVNTGPKRTLDSYFITEKCPICELVELNDISKVCDICSSRLIHAENNRQKAEAIDFLFAAHPNPLVQSWKKFWRFLTSPFAPAIPSTETALKTPYTPPGTKEFNDSYWKQKLEFMKNMKPNIPENINKVPFTPEESFTTQPEFPTNTGGPLFDSPYNDDFFWNEFCAKSTIYPHLDPDISFENFKILRKQQIEENKRKA